MKKRMENKKADSRGAWKKLIIHIGMHKTGSSSIQNSLHANPDNGKFKYIELDTANHSVPLQTAFRKKMGKTAEVLVSEGARAGKNKTLKSIVSQITHDDSETFILSGESLTIFSKEELEEMKSFFSDYFDDIRIVAYVRAPKGFMESSFQQKLKRALTYVPVDDVYPDYHERFKKFDQVFGRSNVQLWKFDPKTFPANDVVMDFCTRLGIPFKKANSVKVNESLSLEAIALLYVYRKYGPSYGVGKEALEQMNFVLKQLGRIGDKKFKLGADLMKIILERHQKDVAWMESRLGDSLRETLVDDPDAIHSEEELETIALDAVKALEPLVDQKYVPEGCDVTTVEGVAALVEGLRLMGTNVLEKRSKKENLLAPFTGLKTKIKPDQESADILKEVALAFEASGDAAIALSLMEKALELRPNGPFFKKKIKEYKQVDIGAATPKKDKPEPASKK